MFNRGIAQIRRRDGRRGLERCIDIGRRWLNEDSGLSFIPIPLFLG
jgi:hypothetical protein